MTTYNDLSIDPYQLRNVAFTLYDERVSALHDTLETLRSCKGAEECDPPSLGGEESTLGTSDHNVFGGSNDLRRRGSYD